MEPDAGGALDAQEIARYSRHLTLPDVGMEGQRRLRAASVLLVGAGGLGSPLAMYLAAAGVGRLGIVDFDEVDLSNLQRQVLYATEDVGRPKVACARERIAGINPRVHVETHAERLDAGNALRFIENYEIVCDGSDNFTTRYLVNDACVLSGKPNVYGSVFRFEGQVSIFGGRDEAHPAGARGPCYRCLYPEPPAPGSVPNCAEGGVLGVLPGVIGMLQATETIKLILGRGDPLVGRLLLFDALEMRFRELKLRRDPDCPVCGDRPTIRELVACDETCSVAAPEVDLTAPDAVDVTEVKRRMDRGDSFVLLDVRTQEEWRICRLEGALLIPLNELPGRIAELDPDDEFLVYCRIGVRSANAVRFLRERGFARASNVSGGLHAWSKTIDPTVPRY